MPISVNSNSRYSKNQHFTEKKTVFHPYFASKKTAINKMGTDAKQTKESLTDEMNETIIPVANVEMACKIKLNG